VTEHGVGEHAPGLFPVPGDGVLARHGDLILLCSLEESQTADNLLDLLEQIAAERGDGRQFTGAIADALDAEEGAPSVLAFGPAGSGLAVAVSGGAWADLSTTEGTVRVEAGHPRLLLRCALRSPVSGVRGGLTPDDNGAASTDRFSRLDAGTVRAGGLSYYQAGAAGGGLGTDTGQGAGGVPGAAGGGAVRLGKLRGPKAAPAQTRAAEARLAGVPVAQIPEQDSAEPEPAGGASGEPDLAGGAGAGPESAGAPQPAAAEPARAESARAESARAESARAEAVRAEAPAELSRAPETSSPGASFEPTAAWVSPDTPVAGPPDAPRRQATDLWAPPGQPAGQAPPLAQGDLPSSGAGASAAEDLEREVTAPPEPVESAQQAGAGQPYQPAEPFEAVLLLDAGSASGVEQRARQPLAKIRDLPPGTSSYVSAGPIIQGVYCKNGHFDDPDALFCAICGISMNQQTLVPRPGERPPLGVLLLDDGAVFQLDSDYVVGREPGLDSSVAAGNARPLRVSDESGIVSRVHARIQLDGWRVLVTDLGSANGTRVLLPSQPADQPLAPQVPVVLATGSQVDLGGRGFRYESHRGR